METPTLAHLLKRAIEHRLLDVHTALIAKIERYDVATQCADVSPILKRTIQNNQGEWTTEALPVLCDVPVLFPQAGGFFISFPLQPGDHVQLLFNEVSIDDWVTGTASPMPHSQRFSLQGAVAIPGICPNATPLRDAHKSNFVAGKDSGIQIHIDHEKIRLGSADAQEALAIASKVKEELDRIKHAFNGHSHTGSMGPIKPTDNLIAESDIAAKYVVTL